MIRKDTRLHIEGNSEESLNRKTGVQNKRKGEMNE
jgi:hypothetical protein